MNRTAILVEDIWEKILDWFPALLIVGFFGLFGVFLFACGGDDVTEQEDDITVITVKIPTEYEIIDVAPGEQYICFSKTASLSCIPRNP